MKRLSMFLIILSLLMLCVTLSGLLDGGRQQHSLAQAHASCLSIPASPNYLATGRPEDAVAALDNAHRLAQLPPLQLPANFYRLDPARQQLLILNQERGDRGLPPLTLDPYLSQLATAYSRQLRDLNFFDHSSPLVGNFEQRVNDNPLLADHYQLAAENLAGNPVPGIGSMYEYMYNDAAENCAHRQNILDPELTLIGIGWVSGSRYGAISAQEFLTPSSLDPYQVRPSHAPAPEIAITHIRFDTASTNVLLAEARVHDSFGGARVTWFLDRFGNQPQSGLHAEYNLKGLSPGGHTLLAYVVNGNMQYSAASYHFSV